MKILVIGHSVEDHIHQDGNEKIRPGGIYYSVLGLLRVASPNDEISLITALQKDNYDLFSAAYDRINTDKVIWVDEIPKVHLFIHDKGERTECFETIPKNLNINYSMLKDYDGMLINMISGFDISLEQLAEIRKNYSGLIYFDVHTLSRGLNTHNARVFRPIENFYLWVKQLDFIQANKLEAETLFNRKDEFETAKEIIYYGAKCLIVTKGDLGAKVFIRDNDEIASFSVSAETVRAINKVGCGDIFGSVFFHSYLKNNSFQKSLELANNIAGKSATVKNPGNLNF